MRPPSQSRSTRLCGQGLAQWQLLPRSGFLTHRLGLAPAAHFGWPRTRTSAAPAPDDRKLFDRPIVVEDATLSPSMKLRSWTSQLL